MQRMGRWAALAVVTLALQGCATGMNVSAYVERGVNIAQYRTYDWGPADALPTGDPRLDNNPFFIDHLEGAVEKQLAGKGYARSTSGTPDLLIHYHASINHRFDVYEADRSRGYCYSDCQPTVVDYEQGTLVIDIVDTHTDKVVWRGWAQDSVKGVIDNQDRMERQISEAVTKMFRLLPQSL